MRWTAVAVALIALTGGTGDRSRTEVLSIRSSDVTARTETDASIGQYYTTTLPLPPDLTASDLDRAILELYVNVQAKPRDGYMNETPLIEVYALTSPLSGALEANKLDTRTRVARPVTLGRGHRVILDITPIVRAQLSGRASNHGLVIGSLTGLREGDYTLVSGKLPDSAVARVRIYRRPERPAR
jgi:hypothetical protein